MILGSSDKYHISNAAYENAARMIGCDLNAVKAVSIVESGDSDGWLDKSRVVILFEGQIFWNELQKAGINPVKYEKSYSDVLYRTWTTKYYKGGIAEYGRLEKAERINRSAALKSASYGAFQILGRNYGECMCGNVDEFIRKMHTSSDDQLMLFINYIRYNKMSSYLKNHQWASFAYCYNGKDYQKNHYDQKLSEAYRKLS